MSMINAALVESFDEPPRYRTMPEPSADAGHELVDVLAVGVHPVTRGVAAGKHYTSPKSLPMLAGVDAVVRRPDGSLAFVMAPRTGTLAERIVIDPARSVPVPAEADPATVAATMNPAVSSWGALRARVGFTAGQSLLVMGATGKAGSMAVRVARLLGAGQVIAAGRNRDRLDQLLTEGADQVVPLTGDDDATAAALAEAASEVDVVLDYVWGPPTELAMRAILDARTDHIRLLDWVQVGGTAGSDITLGGHALRANALRVSGSGFGSVSIERAGLGELAAAVAAGDVAVRPRRFALADVEQAWAHEDDRTERTVIIPG